MAHEHTREYAPNVAAGSSFGDARARFCYAGALMRSASFFVWVALCAGMACGSKSSSGGSGGAGGGGDGKIHPPTNGTHTTEQDACMALESEQSTLAQGFSNCIITGFTCPALVRAQTGAPACSEYDEGSVEGCVALYEMATSCDDLMGKVADCVVTAYPGTTSAGCSP